MLTIDLENDKVFAYDQTDEDDEDETEEQYQPNQTKEGHFRIAIGNFFLGKCFASTSAILALNPAILDSYCVGT